MKEKLWEERHPYLAILFISFICSTPMIWGCFMMFYGYDFMEELRYQDRERPRFMGMSIAGWVTVGIISSILFPPFLSIIGGGNERKS